nr:hypothetical protein [Agrobacterium tumefaciens]
MRIAILIAALLAAGTSLAAERNVTDAAGRTVSVPEKPQRIVVMHEPLLGVPLMDLDANVVGAYGRNSDGKFATAVDFIDTVLGEGRTKPKGFGAVGQIDLEKLRALQPDLIVAEMPAGKAAQQLDKAGFGIAEAGGNGSQRQRQRNQGKAGFQIADADLQAARQPQHSFAVGGEMPFHESPLAEGER